MYILPTYYSNFIFFLPTALALVEIIDNLVLPILFEKLVQSYLFNKI